MSRVIVKNLPKNISEQKIRELFSQKGIVTDVQLKYTKDGIFRRFCFVGYETENEARTAMDFFNKACVATSRLSVEICAPLGDGQKQKSWSKYSKDSTAYKKLNNIIDEPKNEKEIKVKKKNKDNIEEIIGEHKDDPEFIEYMKVHSKDKSVWDNDLAVAKVSDHKMSKKAAESDVSNEIEDKFNEDSGPESDEVKVADTKISDIDYMKALMNKSTSEGTNSVSKISAKSNQKTDKDINFFTIKIFNLPYSVKRQDVIKFFKPLKPKSVRIPINIKGYCYVGFKTEKDFNKAMAKNKSFIKGKQISMVDFTDDNKKTLKKKLGLLTAEEEEEIKTGVNSKWAKQEESLRNEENIAESGKIYFRNLTYSITENDIQALFEKFGPIAEVNLPIDPHSRKIKGFGTVTFMIPEHAVMAFNDLDGIVFHGRMLHLLPGKTSKDKNEKDDDDETVKLSYKEKKAREIKKTAGSSHNWNTLFLGANAVAEILAKTYETSKEHVLDSSGGGTSAAVRLALGETQIVMDMKKFLEENDVYLDAFEQSDSKKRSKTVILAKNLPANTRVSEIQPLFAKFGLLGRVILPPSGVTALIEFLDPSEAKKAFKGLAYSKFKDSPLYLEWAPSDTFKSKAEIQLELTKVDTDDNVGNFENEDKIKSSKELVDDSKKKLEYEEPINNVSDELDEEPESETTLFIRNLNFASREEAIRKHFNHLGSIHMAQVAMKKDPDNPQNKLSLGYGFIQFKRKSSAEKALRTMQFTTIEGNKVELKRSDRTLKSDANVKTNRKVSKTNNQQDQQTGSKILVRNIPFQAKESEVREIFKAFGEVKSIRLPFKMTPGEQTHRGFGFVEFFTKSDAKKAFEAVSHSTHLYGRRLVLEWAAGNEDVTELRKRTASQFAGSGSSTVKRSRKGVFDGTITTLNDGDNYEN